MTRDLLRTKIFDQSKTNFQPLSLISILEESDHAKRFKVQISKTTIPCKNIQNLGISTFFARNRNTELSLNWLLGYGYMIRHTIINTR